MIYHVIRDRNSPYVHEAIECRHMAIQGGCLIFSNERSQVSLVIADGHWVSAVLEEETVVPK